MKSEKFNKKFPGIFFGMQLSDDFQRKTTVINLRVLHFLSAFMAVSFLSLALLEIVLFGQIYSKETNAPSLVIHSVSLAGFIIIFILTLHKPVPDSIKKKHKITDISSTVMIIAISAYYTSRYYEYSQNFSLFMIIILITSFLLFQGLLRTVIINVLSPVILIIFIILGNRINRLLITQIVLTIPFVLLSFSINRKKLQISHHIYENEKRIRIQNDELSTMNGRLLEANSILERLSSIDELTGIPNRRIFNEILDHEWKRAQRNRHPIAMLMIDIDYFKRLNDSYGHQYGDSCLKEVAVTLAQSLHRPADLVTRFGGEEFTVLLPDTEASGAAQIAEKIASDISVLNLENRESEFGRITVSIGLACIIPETGSPSSILIEMSDTALYEAKKSGRNRIITGKKQPEI